MCFSFKAVVVVVCALSSLVTFYVISIYGLFCMYSLAAVVPYISHMEHHHVLFIVGPSCKNEALGYHALTRTIVFFFFFF